MNLKTIILLTAGLSVGAQAQTHWVGTWATAPSPVVPIAQMRTMKLEFNNQTLREIVHVSIGGDTVRVRLANTYSPEPVNIGAVHIAVRAQGSGIVEGSDRALSFSGRPGLQIPANAVFLSDPVKLNVPAGGDLAISIYVPGIAPGGGIHYSAMQTSYVASGDVTAAPVLDNSATTRSWIFLTGVDVLAPMNTGSIVAIGDSITDGAQSTVDTNHRWPDILAARLVARKSHYSVVNMGIGANRILHDGANNPRAGANALARFEHDVLGQPGVKYVMVLEGINDIGHAGSSAPASEAASAEDIIAGLKQMIERAHEHGIKVIAATLTPFEGEAQSSRGYYTPEKGKIREAVNDWIRTATAFDGVVDFDNVMRDPKSPNRMLAAYDSGDQLHPSDAGYKAMGDAIDLNLFSK